MARSTQSVSPLVPHADCRAASAASTSSTANAAELEGRAALCLATVMWWWRQSTERGTFGVVCDEDDAASRGECDLVWCEMEEDRLECFHDEGQVSMFS